MNMFKDRIFSSKSVASRELGKLEIPREMRSECIKGEVAPFTIDDKILKRVLAEIKGEPVAEPKAAKPKKCTQADLDHLFGTKSSDDEPELTLEALYAESGEVPPYAVKSPKPEVKAAPVKAADKVVANGKTYPMRGVCKAIWDECERYYADMKQVPTPAEMQQIGIANNWHKVTVYRQYNDWKTFKGFRK